MLAYAALYVIPGEVKCQTRLDGDIVVYPSTVSSVSILSEIQA